jgi:hypothetical protein
MFPVGSRILVYRQLVIVSYSSPVAGLKRTLDLDDSSPDILHFARTEFVDVGSRVKFFPYHRTRQCRRQLVWRGEDRRAALQTFVGRFGAQSMG